MVKISLDEEEILKKQLINHAKFFGQIQDRKNNINIEYLAGIEIIVSNWFDRQNYTKNKLTDFL